MKKLHAKKESGLGSQFFFFLLSRLPGSLEQTTIEGDRL